MLIVESLIFIFNDSMYKFSSSHHIHHPHPHFLSHSLYNIAINWYAQAVQSSIKINGKSFYQNLHQCIKGFPLPPPPFSLLPPLQYIFLIILLYLSDSHFSSSSTFSFSLNLHLHFSLSLSLLTLSTLFLFLDLSINNNNMITIHWDPPLGCSLETDHYYHGK